ncbi:hypothetical protein FB45DRAFT_948089 [Roridomyces roridus]|uniref:RING-CH-type domain-containing protein n=1 Tax=Roridomyces roridus TaxID=1738132 RepID=A0AAD7F9X7_9AGAR|nr:hypothetical protein FB45DRAFT_948089 [Roridomyces roridus]
MSFASTMNDGDIPTLDDLRVKSCFICLEEETTSSRNKRANAWVHPCPNCPLLAHDKCLLRWIGTLPIRPARRRRRRDGDEDPDTTYPLFQLDTFRCPRCKRQYELANPVPPPLHTLGMILDSCYVLTSLVVDLACTTVGIVAIQALPIALSVQSRIVVLSGMFLYEVAFLRSYLGDRMFNLLMTDNPSNLLRSLFIIVPVIPFRLLIPGTIRGFIIPLYMSFPLFFGFMTETESSELDYLPKDQSVSIWPPSPAWLGLMIVPMLRPIYRQLFSRLRTRVLGSPLPYRPKRYLSDRVRRMFTFRRAPAPADPIPPEEEEDPAQVVVAESIVRQEQSSLMHDVLHAVLSLVIPPIFGNALLAAAPRSLYLRRFLGLRPESGLVPRLSSYHSNWAGMTLRQRLAVNFGAVGSLLFGGSWMWADMDPAWWRNTLGYGLFVLAKDCLELHRLWLQTREVKSRTIKSRDFSGVDVKELDLIDPGKFI